MDKCMLHFGRMKAWRIVSVYFYWSLQRPMLTRQLVFFLINSGKTCYYCESVEWDWRRSVDGSSKATEISIIFLSSCVCSKIERNDSSDTLSAQSVSTVQSHLNLTPICDRYTVSSPNWYEGYATATVTLRVQDVAARSMSDQEMLRGSIRTALTFIDSLLMIKVLPPHSFVFWGMIALWSGSLFKFCMLSYPPQMCNSPANGFRCVNSLDEEIDVTEKMMFSSPPIEGKCF